MQVIENWTDQDRQDYGKKVQAVSHNLAQSGLFTDAALAALLDRHPNEKIDVCAMTHDPDCPDKHCTVDFRGQSGRDLIKAAKAGQIWINIREAMTFDPAYQTLAQAAYDDLERCTGRDRLRRNCRGGILISSPSAKVPYHCDPTMTLLWHIRGQKRVYVYPNDERFLPDDAYEAVVLGEEDQDIPYRAEFDDDAQVFDLSDNTLVMWPHASPHRVENRSYCISMVMEFTSKDSALRNSVMFTNGLLRRRFGLSPRWSRSTPLGRFIKSTAGHILRKLGAHNPHIRTDLVKMKLDPSAKNYLRPVQTYVRNF